MADKKIHIIITGEEGNGSAIAVGKKNVRNAFIGTLLITVSLTAGTFAGFNLYKKNITLASWTETLDLEL